MSNESNRVFTDEERAELRAKIEAVRKPQPNGCLYVAHPNSKSTKFILLNGLRISHYRASWIAYRGQIPEGMMICHHCDDRLCGNIEHLFLGTGKDNIQDALKKDRMAFGTRHHLSKLNPEKANEIIWMRIAGMSTYEIAEHFGMDRSSICSVLTGETWSRKSGWKELKHLLPERIFTQFGKRKDILTEDQKVEICSRVGLGESAKAVAEEFDLCAVHVYRIAADPKYWRHDFARKLPPKSARKMAVTDELVRVIFQLKRDGMTGRDIARKLDLNENVVCAILRGAKYTHLAPEIPRPPYPPV